MRQRCPQLLSYNGTRVSYSYSPYDPSVTVGGGAIDIGPAVDDSLPPGVGSMLNRAGNMASPFVNFADAGVTAFGGLVAPIPMALAQYVSGNASKYDLVIAALPELKGLGFLAKEESAISGVLKQIASGTTKGKIFENFAGSLLY